MGAMCCACMDDSRCRAVEVQRDQQMAITGLKGRTLEGLGGHRSRKSEECSGSGAAL